MRTWSLLLLSLMACTGPRPTPPPPSIDLGPLNEAVAAWRTSPTDAHLERVSTVAAQVDEAGAVDRGVDLALADALSEVLLRPDLARPRIEPHVASLSPTEQKLWLNVLLRSGDVQTFAAEAERLNGTPYDPDLPALLAASGQSKTHLHIDWAQAGRAHDAAVLANQHVRLQRKKVDRPLPDVGESLRTLARLYPKASIQAVFTRATNPEEPDPRFEAGAIPAKRGKRRVVSYAATVEEFDAATEAFLNAAPPRTVGVIAQVHRESELDLVYCGEGRLEHGQFWMVSGCDGHREAAWLKATERYLDLKAADRSEAEASAIVRERFVKDDAERPQ